MKYQRRYSTKEDSNIIFDELSAIGFLLAIIAILSLLSACATITTDTILTDAAGNKTITHTHAAVLGRTEAITGLSDDLTPGSRKIGVGAANGDVNVKALEQTNNLLGTLVEGLVKGAAAAAK